MPASIFNGDAVKILKDKLRFKTTGEIGWDSTNGCPSYPSDIANVTNQIGQETHVRVYNGTGSTIPDGSAVYITGGDPDGLHPSIALAIANDYHKSRVLGLVTAEILTGAHGIVTRDGIVNGLNTLAYTSGDILKLSSTVAGTYSAVSPNDGNFDVSIGVVVKDDATTGSILVYHDASYYTVETNQKTGWSNAYGPATISFTDVDRTLLLTKVNADFHFYQEGTKYSKLTDSFQIADTEGLHFIYYNLGVLAEIINPTAAQIDNAIRNYVTVAYVGWDATAKENIYVGKELHDMQFPVLVHSYNHFAYGARYLQGLGLTSILAEQTGNSATHAQFGVNEGSIADEDIYLPTSTIASTTGLPIFYLAGTSTVPVLRKTTQANFSVKTTGTGRLAFNTISGGNWIVSEASNGNFVLCHVFVINENNILKRPIAFMGQAQYTTVALARIGAEVEISNLILTSVVPNEIKSIGTVIFETRDSYTNSVNARIREVSTGVNYVDWRSINNTGGSNASGSAFISVYSDSAFQIYDDLDATKTAQFQASGITTGTNRILTIPDASTTIVGTDTPQTLSNKNLDDANLLITVYNPTGSTIPKGSCVYINGVDPDGIHQSVALALADDAVKSRVFGIVTADILTTAHGTITREGRVTGLDTSSYVLGDILKLSSTTPGGFVKTAITGANFDVTIGVVEKVNASTGEIRAMRNNLLLATEIYSKTGFSNEFGSATINFVNATRILTITPTATSFTFYERGIKYSKTTDAITIADTEGRHLIYYNAGTLTDLVNGTSAQEDLVIKNFPLVARIAWNATNSVAPIYINKMHDVQFPSIVRLYNSKAYGPKYISGMNPNTLSVDASGSLNTSAQIGMSLGEMVTEDISYAVAVMNSTSGCYISYFLGTTASPTYRVTSNFGYPVIVWGSGRLAYNFLTGGNWTQVEVTDNYFVLVHFYSIGSQGTTGSIRCVSPIAQYQTIALAREQAAAELTTINASNFYKDSKFLFTFVYETSSTFSNAVKARVRSFSPSETYIDWRAVNTNGAVSIGALTTVYPDNLFQIYDNSDPTKTFQFQGSGITTATNRTLTIPNADTTIVGTDVAQILTNKTVDDAITHKQIATPALPASGYNKLYPKADGLYYYQTPTAEFPVDLKGDYNFIATKLATDWIGYDDGAADFPVNGVDGTATGLTLVAATSPISSEPGVINIKLTKDAVDRQGKGFGLPFSTRGDIDKAAIRVCKINIASTAAYLDGDIIVMLYDTTNSRLIYPADQRIFASSLVSAQQFEFQLSSDSTAYRLILHVASTNASAYELNGVIKFVETKKQTGPVVSDWVSYTPTLSDATNINPGYPKAFWRRVGDSIHVKGTIYWNGNGAGSTFAVSLPTGFVADTSKLEGSSDSPCGYGTWFNNGTDYADLQVTRGSFTTVVFIESDTLNSWDGSQAANGDYINFNAQVPIAGWSSNQVLSEDAGNRNIYVRAVKSGDQTITAGAGATTITGFTETEDTSSSFDPTTGIFTAPETGYYDSDCTVNMGTNATPPTNAQFYLSGNSLSWGRFYSEVWTGSKAYYFPVATTGIFLTKGQTLTLIGQCSGQNITCAGAGTVWTIAKRQSPQQIAASAINSIRYTSTSGQSISTSTNSVINFANKVYDDFTSVTTGAGWKYEPNQNARYRIDVSVKLLGSTDWDTGDRAQLFLRKNGSTICMLDEFSPFATGADLDPQLHGATELDLTTVDDIDAVIYHTTGATLTLSTNSIFNYITITKIGGV